jgi:hypothetical protein
MISVLTILKIFCANFFAYFFTRNIFIKIAKIEKFLKIAHIIYCINMLKI